MKKDKNWNKKIILVAALLLIFFIIRYFGLFKTMFGDEFYPWHIISTHDFGKILLGDRSGHTPLYIWANAISSLFFGISDFAFRFASLVFSMGSLFMIYLTGKRLFGEKSAVYSLLLMGLSFWHIMFSTQIHHDAPFLMFFYLLTFYSAIRFIEKYEKKWLVWTGVGLGLGLLTKFTMILIVPVILIHFFANKMKIKDIMKNGSLIILIGFAMLMIFPISSMYYLGTFNSFPGIWTLYLLYFGVGAATTQSINFILLGIQLIQALIFMTPLYLGLIFFMFSGIDRKKISLIMWFAISVFFYMFIVHATERSLERYLIILLVPICILGGDFISKIRFKKKEFILGIVLFLISFIIILSLNLFGGRIIDFYPKQAYYQEAMSFDWQFYVPFGGNAGPLGFYVMFSSIMYSFLIGIGAAILALIFHIRKKLNLFKIFFVIFLSTSLAFNVFMTQEYLFSTTSPDIDLVSKEIVQYSVENKLKEPLFIFRNGAISEYMTQNYSKFEVIHSEDEFDLETIEKIKTGGTVLIVDYPQINKQSPLWSQLMACKTMRTFEDKGFVIGYIFSC